MMNLRLFLSTLMAFIAAMVGAQTSISIHSDSDGGSGISWALVRVTTGVASIGDLGGVHIGEVHHDDLFCVRDGKAYEIRDDAVMRRVAAADGPVEKIRELKQKAKEHWREIRQQERAEEREKRGLDRSKSRLVRTLDLSETTATHSDLVRQITEIDRQMADIDRQIRAMSEHVDAEQKKVDAVQKSLDGARVEREKRVEAIFNEALAKGLAKPYP